MLENTLEFNLKESESHDSKDISLKNNINPVKSTYENKALLNSNNNNTFSNISNEKLLSSKTETSTTSSKEYLKNYSNTQPYLKAIKSLRQLREINTPLDKMLLIANLSNEITEAVNDYWSNTAHVEKSLLDINVDELVAIFIYLILKSQMPELVYHLNMIKEFTTTITRNSMVGFYYTTMDAAKIYICSLKDRSELFECRERTNSNASKLNSQIQSNSSLMDEN